MTPTDLRAIRTERLVVDRETLGAWLGVDPVTVWRWETGSRAMPGPAMRLVRALVEVPGAREWLEQVAK